MGHLQWGPELNTGIDVIDNQHRRIVQFINQLNDVKAAGDRRILGEVIEGMVDYTLSHFAFEETLMADAKYPFLHGHQKIHEIFVARVNKFRDRFLAGEEVGDELHGLLVRWLIQHIQNDDAAYVGAVRQQMLGLLEEKHEEGWLARSLSRFFGKK